MLVMSCCKFVQPVESDARDCRMTDLSPPGSPRIERSRSRTLIAEKKEYTLTTTSTAQISC